jgi:hypothetical protein
MPGEADRLPSRAAPNIQQPTARPNVASDDRALTLVHARQRRARVRANLGGPVVFSPHALEARLGRPDEERRREGMAEAGQDLEHVDRASDPARGQVPPHAPLQRQARGPTVDRDDLSEDLVTRGPHPGSEAERVVAGAPRQNDRPASRLAPAAGPNMDDLSLAERR